MDKENFFKGLIPDDQLSEIKDVDKFWSTIEPQHLVEKAYPSLVETFLQSKVKPKKCTRRKKKEVDIEKLNESMNNISLCEPPLKKSRKRGQKSKEQLKIDDFLKKAITNNFNKKTEFEHTSTPIKKFNIFEPDSLNVTLDVSNFEDENDSDLSDIVDNILSKKLPDGIRGELENLGYEIDDRPKTEKCASFFMNSLVENDLFEKTFDEKYISSDEEIESQPEHDEVDNSFDVDYVPLLERLNRKKM